MSAINAHLNWHDIEDFTAGLFTEAMAQKQFAMPDTAAQQMDNCLPVKQGGIRAFFKPVSVASTNIGAAETCTGIAGHSGLPLRSGASGDSFYRFLWTQSSADSKQRLYKMDGSNAETVWSQKDASWTLAAGSNSAARSTTMFPFLDSSGNRWMIAVVRYNNAAAGMYKIAYVAGAGPPAGDGVITKLNSATGAAVANQGRLIISDGSGTRPHRLYYGDVGLTTGAITTLANFLDIAPYQNAAAICIVHPIEPSDLIIGREGSPWVQIGGDVSNTGTAVREVGAGHYGMWTEQVPARTPTGIAYIEPGGYVYLTDGRQFTALSMQIDRFYKADGTNIDLVSPGGMAFLGSYLFAPKGYIRDWETGAWFRNTDLNNASYWTADARQNRVWGVNGANGFTQFDLFPFDRLSGTGSGTNRYHTYTWRSAPLTPKDGREARVREVQLFARVSATTDFTVTRTDSDGTQVTRTITGVTAASGPQMLSFLFPNSGAPYQDVTVTPTCQVSTNEAPVIERVRIGFVLGHQR